MDKRILKYLAGELSQEEKERFVHDVNTNELLRQDVESAMKMEALMKMAPRSTDKNVQYTSFRGANNKEAARYPEIKKTNWWRYVAAVLFCFMMSYVYWTKTTPPKMQVAMQTLTIPVGQRAQLVLPDGTEVWANSGSKITYPSVFGDERNVKLEGEALFYVAKDDKHPFIVTANNYCVKALGTTFNVEAYKENSSIVTLLEGSVKVYEANKEENGVVLQPHYKLVCNGPLMSVEAASGDVIEWKDGMIVFTKQSMAEIIGVLQKRFNVTIKVKNNAIDNFVYSGKFRQDDGVETILNVISRVHHFKIEYQKAQQTIYLSMP